MHPKKYKYTKIRSLLFVVISALIIITLTYFWWATDTYLRKPWYVLVFFCVGLFLFGMSAFFLNTSEKILSLFGILLFVLGLVIYQF
jgi:hypothetical protein